jgi:aminopeptidase C
MSEYHLTCAVQTQANSVRRFVYQVVVPKTLAPKELVKVLEGDDKVVLPPWDPMVSL